MPVDADLGVAPLLSVLELYDLPKHLVEIQRPLAETSARAVDGFNGFHHMVESTGSGLEG